MLHKLIACITLLTITLAANAQSLKKPLAEANTIFAGVVEFKVDTRNRLVMDCFDEGQRYRQDIAAVKELDVDSIFWSAGEESIVLKCIPGKTKCFSKEIFKLDMVRLTARSNIPCPIGDPEGKKAIAVLKELIQAAQGDVAAIPNATSMDGSRRTGR